MRELYLDQHSIICHCGNGKNPKGIQRFCEINPTRFLFFLGTKFILITYHQCMEHLQEYDFKKQLINQVIEDNNIFEFYEVQKSVNVADTLREFRIRNQALKNKIQQVNYLYEDLCGKQYAITTTIDYFDWLCNQDEIDQNFEDAKDTMLKKEYNWLLPQLKELYLANKVYNQSETEYHKTIEHIIKSINQITK